jgi:hypothetical protein
MIEIRTVQPIRGRRVRLTLSDGTQVERDLSGLLQGPLLGRLADDDALFSQVRVEYGTLVWPGELDIAPETLIWDGPTPLDDQARRPAPVLRPRPPADRRQSQDRAHQ